MQTPLTFFVAFLVVLALIGAAAWLARRFAGSRLGQNANRGRAPRLAVIDAAAVDGRRRLVLVRRDNIEHLLMIGGPTDIVVEPNIVRASPAREPAPQRTVPMPEPSWAEAEMPREPIDFGEPITEAPRATRNPFPEEARRAPQPPRPAADARPRPSDPFAGLTADLPTRIDPPARERAPQRTEPLMPRPVRATEGTQPKVPPIRAVERPAPAASADQNLAEMAQRLEAALRRPAGEPKPENANGSGDRAPSVAPEAPRPIRAVPSEVQAPTTEDNDGEAPKAPFKNLEEEMASLLGRPKTPT
jgi:hypothetical protein